MRRIFEKRWLRRLVSIILTLLIVFVILQIIPPGKVRETNPFLRRENEGVLMAAHRGGMKLNPENTLRAFDSSIKNYDVDIIELDLVLTKDDYLVAIHDQTINRTSDVEEVLGTDEPYYVNEHTLAELLFFNFGYKFKDSAGNYPYKNLVGFADPNRQEILRGNNLNIATIQEIFSRYQDLDLLYIIEIKDSGELGKRAADILINLILEFGLEEFVTVGTFHNEISKYLEDIYPQGLRGGSVGDVTKFILTQIFGVNLFDGNSFSALQIPVSQDLGFLKIKLDKQRYIKRAHRRGISVQYWTINDYDEMVHLIEAGADVIMTDSLDVLAEVLRDLGYR